MTSNDTQIKRGGNDDHVHTSTQSEERKEEFGLDFTARSNFPKVSYASGSRVSRSLDGHFVWFLCDDSFEYKEIASLARFESEGFIFQFLVLISSREKLGRDFEALVFMGEMSFVFGLF